MVAAAETLSEIVESEQFLQTEDCEEPAECQYLAAELDRVVDAAVASGYLTLYNIGRIGVMGAERFLSRALLALFGFFCVSSTAYHLAYLHDN